MQEELDAIVRDELTDPRLTGVRVTHVDVAADLSSARVWYALSGPEPIGGRAAVAAALEHAAGFLRARLMDALELRRTPELRFVRDEVSAHLANVTGSSRTP